MGVTERYKKWLFALIMCVLFLPLILTYIPLFETEEYVVEYGTVNPALTSENWFSGKFQKEKSTYIKHSVPLRMELVRLSNQLYFSLFNQGRSNSVVVGKDGTLLLEKQIASLQGQDFIGAKSIAREIDKYEYVRDCLDKRGVKLLIAVVPSKSYYYQELIPNWLKIAHPKKSNYAEYVEQWKKRKIAYFDAVPWLLKQKHKAKHRMYPSNGLHYTKYGQFLIMDSLTRFLEGTTSMNFPRLKLHSVSTPSKVQKEDKELAEYLTIFSDLPDSPLSSPHYSMHSKGETAKVLTVGDSYFMGMCNSDFCHTLFNEGQFWYYNREIRTRPNKIDGYVSQIDPRLEVEKHNVVLLFVSDANCDRLSFGFIHQMYNVYQTLHAQRVQFYTEQIVADEAWTEVIRAKAKAKGISLEEAIQIDAEYLYELEEVQ